MMFVVNDPNKGPAGPPTASIQPVSAALPAPQVVAAEAQPVAPVPAPAAESAATPPPPQVGAGTVEASVAAADAVAWTVSGSVHRQKPSGWYVQLGLGVLAIAVIVFLVTRDIFSVCAVTVGIILFAMYESRPPRGLEYRLDQSGITVGRKHYAYGNFRSFALVPGETFSSIVLMPLKRFAPLMTVYYAEADQDRIVAFLKDSLPYADYRRDAIDKLMHRLGFD